MIQIIARLLAVLAGVIETRDPGSDLSDYLGLAALLVREGDQARQELESLTADVEGMVAAGRAPSEEEIQAVRARRQELSNRIQDVDLSGETGADDPD